MPKNLLIVESPAKAKTIQKYLGKDFTVKSSFGHIRDLHKGEDAVDVENDFAPKYVIPADKKKQVKELKDAVKKVDEVWLATDEDREGEAISWHLCKVLGLDESTTKRIVFHEITKPAIQKAVSNPRALDINLVNAQQARRVLDRLVGYKLSGILWKKIKGKLSAGRVQSVAVKLIVEREREINKFEVESFFRIVAIYNVVNGKGKKVQIKAESPKRFKAEGDAESFLKNCIGADFPINNIEVKPIKRKPAPPFTTSTLQQEASRKLYFPVNKTMRVAQQLYEAGYITYMRTDSVTLSNTALGLIQQEIENKFGQEYAQFRRFKNKSSSAQEAHEAIRPTNISLHSVGLSKDANRLYQLIWKRTIACQMADAQLEKTMVKIGVSTMPDALLQAVGEVLKFDGFLKVYLESKDDNGDEETQGVLPPLKVGQLLDLDNMKAIESFTRPPGRFAEASLVKKMEELGIGRPSTYAPTITRIMDESKGYVVKESREGKERNFQVLSLENGNISKVTETEKNGAVKNRLFPTDMGITVTDFLEEHFDQIMNYSFTAGIEEKFDSVASGQQEWVKMLDEFYGPFNEKVEETVEHGKRPDRERKLGIDEASGRTMLVRMSRRGPVIQIGTPEELEEGEKPRYANLQPGQTIDTITFEEAEKLFQLPKTLGEFEGKDVIIGLGRYGPYVKYNEKFISIPRGIDPMNISMESAVELIREKQKADAPVATYKALPITKGKGRFGPFIKWNGIFVNVPRKMDFDNLQPEEMFDLIEKKLEKDANRFIHKWEDEGIAVENGRWGPFIRFKKKSVKIPRQEGSKKVTPDEAKALTLEDVKAIIEAALPGSFSKKKKK